MKIKNIILFFSVFLFGVAQLRAQTKPTVSNVNFSISGTTVTVDYDVHDPEQHVFTIYMEVSDDDGTTWDYDYGTATGDIGPGISEGDFNSIQWTYNGPENNNFKIKIIAEDNYGDEIYYAGQIYNTVTIGGKVWLKENLNVGTMLANGSTKATDNGIIEKHCYNDTESNCDQFGGLYSWNELMQYATADKSQGICPDGWHVPDMDDWHTINDATTTMSEIMVDGSNTTGFSAIRGAYLWNGAYSSEAGGLINLFSSHTSGTNAGYSVYFDENYTTLGEYSNPDHPEYAVRCIKN